jgi:hypothetical protein
MGYFVAVGADPDPRIHKSDKWIRIRIRMRILILLFSLVSFKASTNFFLSKCSKIKGHKEVTKQ